MERTLRLAALALGIVAVAGGLFWLGHPDDRGAPPRVGGLVTVLGVVLAWLASRTRQKAD